MDFRQLRYFLAVANEGQVTGAARLLNMEQPPLSRQMKQLERELGVTLFDRSGKRLRLTAAGELLRERAEALLARLGETEKEVRELDEGVRGVLSIGAVVSCVSLLPGPIRRFREQHPQVTFKIREGDHFLLSEQLDKRTIELAVTRLPFEAPFDPARYEVRPLPSDPFAALLPASWVPASRAREMEMRELARYPLLTLKTEHTRAMHERVWEEFRLHGLNPEPLCECSSVAIIVALVAAGIGATVLPKSVVASFPSANIAVFDLPKTGFRSDVGLVWLKDRYLSRSARRFIEIFADPQEH
ncbi:HTH-type transcriptional regulator BsdA [Cohnella xylanilytica]|uniref:LysR family transcriptional regulator n=1 Tax=Cohnella xylanilytica TaxID=557555 RepID=UPI001B07B32C|nr:LysR family transcriptional regulator [Cohnella xylanilytica]GIO15011.1 HTH-type transcriptional regulator BsdA [Cohnella xylanilytica]